MKYPILSCFVLFCLSPALVLGASSGIIDCQGRTGVTALERPNSMVAIRQLSCNQNVSIIGIEQGHVKIQITEHLIGFVEARYIRMVENTAAAEPQVKAEANTATKSATLSDSRPQTSTDSGTNTESGIAEAARPRVSAPPDVTAKPSATVNQPSQINTISDTAVKPGISADSRPEIPAEPDMMAKSDTDSSTTITEDPRPQITTSPDVTAKPSVTVDQPSQINTTPDTAAKSGTLADSRPETSSRRSAPEERPKIDQAVNRTSHRKPTRQDNSSNRNYPRMELFGGYSLQKTSGYPPDDSIDGMGENDVALDQLAAGSSFMKKGFSGSFTYNFTSLLGLEAAIRYHADNTSGTFDTEPDGTFSFQYDFKREDTSFLVGPRFTFRNNDRLVPFAHALVGYSGNKFSLDGTLDAGGTFLSDRDEIVTSKGLGVAVGGGLDLAINDNWAIRLVQADYYMSSHDAPTIKRNFDPMQSAGTLYIPEEKQSFKNIALSFGVVFRFGR